MIPMMLSHKISCIVGPIYAGLSGRQIRLAGTRRDHQKVARQDTCSCQLALRHSQTAAGEHLAREELSYMILPYIYTLRGVEVEIDFSGPLFNVANHFL